MKSNTTKLYARALAEILVKKGIDEKKVVKNFVNLLIKNGQEKKAKEILNLAEDFLLAKQGNKKITLETARHITQAHKAMLKKIVQDGDIVKEKINEDLIAGIKIIINNEKQLDNSMLNKLQNIFK